MKNESRVVENNEQYRNRYRLAVKLLCGFSVSAVVLSTALIAVSVLEATPKYYATQMNGQLVEMKPLSVPVVSDDYVLQWAGLVLRQAFNLSFVNWQTQIDGVMNSFTASGKVSFQQALKDSGMLTSLQNNKLILSSVISGAPVIAEKGVLAGQFYWKVEVPLLLTYNSASAEQKQNMVLRLVIVRVPTLDNEKGIAISSLSPADQIKVI